MGTTRRGFLGLLTGGMAAAGATLAGGLIAEKSKVKVHPRDGTVFARPWHAEGYTRTCELRNGSGIMLVRVMGVDPGGREFLGGRVYKRITVGAGTPDATLRDQARRTAAEMERDVKDQREIETDIETMGGGNRGHFA